MSSIPGWGNGNVQWNAMPTALQSVQSGIVAASQKTGMPQAMLAGVMWEECGGNTSLQGGGGLMQISSADYRPGENGLPQEPPGVVPLDPATNILAAATYISDEAKQYQQQYSGSNWDVALRVYNSGEQGTNFNNLNSIKTTGRANYMNIAKQYAQEMEAGSPLSYTGPTN